MILAAYFEFSFTRALALACLFIELALIDANFCCQSTLARTGPVQKATYSADRKSIAVRARTLATICIEQLFIDAITLLKIAFTLTV